MKPALRIVRLKRAPVLTMLRLEEALFRSERSTGSWCVMNEGSLPPCVVLGISGKPEKLCNLPLVERDEISMIKRFTGGGTVVVDAGTSFVSLICDKSDVDGEPEYPRDIMAWTEGLYDPVLKTLCKPEFG